MQALSLFKVNSRINGSTAKTRFLIRSLYLLFTGIIVVADTLYKGLFQNSREINTCFFGFGIEPIGNRQNSPQNEQ
jgi:hypothetical protein